MAVQGVVTTGIYCRPDCTARPNAENVRPFPTAAAAEAAGFRGCHRYRPYRSEQPIGLGMCVVLRHDVSQNYARTAFGPFARHEEGE